MSLLWMKLTLLSWVTLNCDGNRSVWPSATGASGTLGMMA